MAEGDVAAREGACPHGAPACMLTVTSRSPAADSILAPQRRAQRTHLLQTPDAWILLATAIVAIGCGALVAVTGINALYVSLSVVGCIFIMRDFRFGVVLLILLLPISRSYIFPHEMFGVTGANPLNLLLLGTLGAWLLGALGERGMENFVPRPLLWLYIVPIVIAGFLGCRHVDEIARAFYAYEMLEFDTPVGYFRDTVVKPLFLVLFALLVAAAVRRSKSPRPFLLAALVSVWVMTAMVLIFVLLSGTGFGAMGSSSARSFLSPLGLHANDLGRLYAVAYALLLFTFVGSSDTGLRLVLLASMGAVVIALVLTFSRGAFLGFGLVNLIFLVWHRNAKTLLLLGLGTVAAFFFMPDAVLDRVMTGHGAGANAISAGRIDKIWAPLLPELLDNPIFGSGLNSILWSDAERRGGGSFILLVTHPHNAYLRALMDMGLVGFSLLCAYFVHVWRRFLALGSNKELDPALAGFYKGAAAGLASFLISGISDSALTPVPEQAFLWLAIGMMYGHSSGTAKAATPAPAPVPNP